LGSNAMPEHQPSRISDESHAAIGPAPVMQSDNTMLSEQQRVEAMERAQEEASSSAPYSNMGMSARSESPVQKASIV
jgi:hypothetical protein